MESDSYPDGFNLTPAQDWLNGLGLQDSNRAANHLSSIVEAGLSDDLIGSLLSRLREQLPQVADPDAAIENFARYLAASRSPLAVGTLIERDSHSLGILLQLFGSSPYVSDLIVADPESLDLLRMTDGRSAPRHELVHELCAEVGALREAYSVVQALRRFRHREVARIVYGDIIHRQPVSMVMGQLSHVADAICEAALQTARRIVAATRGLPRRVDGAESAFVVIGLGRIGGEELSYDDTLQLVCLYESDGRTDGSKSVSNDDYFQRLTEELSSLLTLDTDLGRACDVDFSCRPQGETGPLASSVDRALHYYDTMGRTWERQAYVKARIVAGDARLGREFLSEIEPWIYRRFLNRADVAGVQVMKRRIERAAHLETGDSISVHLMQQALADIEQAIQFLQLVHGGQISLVRTGNTLDAIDRLAESGCLTREEQESLLNAFTFLRKLQHRYQIAFRRTDRGASEHVRSEPLASLMGYGNDNNGSGQNRLADEFRRQVRSSQDSIRSLLSDSFGDSVEWIPESDLVLDPRPGDEDIATILRPYGFQDVRVAYRHLTSLGTERIRFLSTRSCRYFLSLIAQDLLRLVGQTPEPDATWENLAHVSDSLGGKGVLWELFSVSPPTLDLYVRLCAGSPYLTSILTENPGMLDDLMDSLVLNKLASLGRLRSMLDELTRGADDMDLVLHNFKGVQHLEAGVRDILGKEDVQSSMAFLADVAQVCLERIIGIHYASLSGRYGAPRLGDGSGVCEFAVVALGKLGAREPNYHSNFDLILLYQSEGATAPAGRRHADATSNQHFFNELAQRIVRQCNRAGVRGQLFELGFDKRTTGARTAAVPVDDFERFYAQGQASIHERQSLCRARPIFGAKVMRDRVAEIIRQQLCSLPLQASDWMALRTARVRLEQTAKPWNLKRRPGGTMDVEYIAQALQLQHAQVQPNVLATSTLEALSRLRDNGCLSREHADSLIESYRYLRSVEARLRLMNASARHDLPSDSTESRKLVYLLGAESDHALRNACRDRMETNRRIFDQIFPRS
jgi:glutamate-ammonia-ligase adenylyltransferase